MFNPKIEQIDAHDLQKLQLVRMQEVLSRVYAHSPLYRDKFDQAGVKPEQLRCLDDLRRFPFTCKQDLRDCWPYGTFAVPMEQIDKIHTTSGTTGKPTVIGFTKNDWNDVIEMAARGMRASTISAGDIVQNTTPYGLFFAGASTQGGAEKAGAAVIPMGPGNPEQQLFFIKNLKPTVIMGVPSFILTLANYARATGFDPASSSLKKAFLLGEPITEATMERIETAWGIKAYSGYGITEIGASGTCPERDGYHWSADIVYLEILDFESGEPVKPGEKGEAVYTTLTRQGVPLIRFRSRDIISRMESCPCGRTLPKISFIEGRLDDRTKIRGTLILPREIEEAILKISQVENYLAVVDNKGDMDILTVYVKSSKDMAKEITQRVKALTNLTPNQVIQVEEIPRGERKMKRFIDGRNPTKSDLEILNRVKK